MAGICLFITGTDTGVGKTTLSCALIAALTLKGLRVAVCKPVETGCNPDEHGALQPLDALLLKHACNVSQSLDEVCPFRFVVPVAPFVAAQREGREISVEQICDVIEGLRARADVVLIEGAGGALVPITADLTYADLAQRYSWKSVVVVGSKLGALNHACLTFEVLKSRRIDLLGYVFNDFLASEVDLPPREVAARATNRAALNALAARYEISEVGYLPWMNPAINLSLAQQALALSGSLPDLIQCVVVVPK